MSRANTDIIKVYAHLQICEADSKMRKKFQDCQSTILPVPNHGDDGNIGKVNVNSYFIFIHLFF